MKTALSTAIAIVIITFSLILPVYGIDTAPRISDREIIEGLADVRSDIKRLEAKIDSEVKRIEDGQGRLESQMNQRFEAVNQRFDDLKWFLGTMIGVLMLINGAVLGYVLKRQGALEKSIETVKDEIAFLKSIIEKLLPPKGVL